MYYAMTVFGVCVSYGQNRKKKNRREKKRVIYLPVFEQRTQRPIAGREVYEYIITRDDDVN